MPDDIYEESYVGEREAWHGKGTVLDRKFTASEAIEYANLDYHIEKVPLETMKGDPVPNRYATVRTDLPVGDMNRVLGVVGPRYTVVQNEDLFSFFDPVVEEGTAIYTSVGVLGHGEEVFITAKLDRDFWVKQDKFKTFVVLNAGHTGWLSIKALATSVRVVCRNTLSQALSSSKNQVKLKHTDNVHKRLVKAHAVLGLAGEEFQETQELFRELANRPVESTQQFEDYIKTLFPSSSDDNPDKTPRSNVVEHRERVAELFDAPQNRTKGTEHTWYSAAQSVIEYVEHEKELRSGKRLAYALFGRGMNLKKKAVNLAVEVSND